MLTPKEAYLELQRYYYAKLLVSVVDPESSRMNQEIEDEIAELGGDPRDVFEYPKAKFVPNKLRKIVLDYNHKRIESPEAITRIDEERRKLEASLRKRGVDLIKGAKESRKIGLEAAVREVISLRITREFRDTEKLLKR